MRLYTRSQYILFVLLLGRVAYCREAPSNSYYYPPSKEKGRGVTSQPWNDQPSSYFYVLTPEGAKGPYSIQEISGMAEKGIIEPDTRVQTEDGETRILGGLLESYWSRFEYNDNKNGIISDDDDGFGGVKDVEGGRFMESVAAVRSGLGAFLGIKDKNGNLLQDLAPQQPQHQPYRVPSRRPFEPQHHPSKTCHSHVSANESPNVVRPPSPPTISAANHRGQRQQPFLRQQQQIYEELYPPPSTSPPPSVVAQGERENVRFADAEFYRSQGTTIDQDECFKPHKKTSYDRKGGFERDEGIDGSGVVIPSNNGHKPSVGGGIGQAQQLYISSELLNSEMGRRRRVIDNNEVSSSSVLSIFRAVGMHWRIIGLTSQRGGYGGVMACFVLAIAKACITLGMMINGIGMFEIISKLQHNGNALLQWGKEYAALVTVLYMTMLIVGGISHAVLFRVGRRTVLQIFQKLLLSSGSDLECDDTFLHSFLTPWQYTRDVLQFTEAGTTLLGSIILLNLVLKGSWMACTTVIGLLVTVQLVKMAAILPSYTPIALLLRTIDLGGNPSKIVTRHRLYRTVSLLLRLFSGVFWWGILSLTLGCSLYFAIQELSDGLIDREQALFLVGFVFLAQHSLRSSIHALRNMQETFPIARRVILYLHERRVSRQGFIRHSSHSSN